MNLLTTSLACLSCTALLSPFAMSAVSFVDISPDQFITKPGAGPGLISQFDIDFNGDGSREVRLFVSSSSTIGFNALPVLGTRIQSVPVNISDYFAYPALFGQSIGPTPIGPSTWVYETTPGSNLGGCVGFGNGTSCFGYFVEGFVGYLSVEFTLPDGVHYGVVEIEGLYGNGLVRSYAWETTPGVPIIAGSTPEPGRTVMLMLGFILTALIRRRNRH